MVAFPSSSILSTSSIYSRTEESGRNLSSNTRAVPILRLCFDAKVTSDDIVLSVF